MERESAQRVVNEIEYVLHKFLFVKIVDIIDDNFFVNKQRVKDICQGVIFRNMAIKWRAIAD